MAMTAYSVTERSAIAAPATAAWLQGNQCMHAEKDLSRFSLAPNTLHHLLCVEACACMRPMTALQHIAAAQTRLVLAQSRDRLTGRRMPGLRSWMSRQICHRQHVCFRDSPTASMGPMCCIVWMCFNKAVVSGSVPGPVAVAQGHVTSHTCRRLVTAAGRFTGIPWGSILNRFKNVTLYRLRTRLQAMLSVVRTPAQLQRQQPAQCSPPPPCILHTLFQHPHKRSMIHSSHSSLSTRLTWSRHHMHVQPILPRSMHMLLRRAPRPLIPHTHCSRKLQCMMA